LPFIVLAISGLFLLILFPLLLLKQRKFPFYFILFKAFSGKTFKRYPTVFFWNIETLFRKMLHSNLLSAFYCREGHIVPKHGYSFQ